jgi:hypothetical protein
MNKREYHPRFTRSASHLSELPVSPDLDLLELQSIGDGSYRVSDHIEQDSDYVPFEQLAPAPDMARFNLRGRS